MGRVDLREQPAVHGTSVYKVLGICLWGVETMNNQISFCRKSTQLSDFINVRMRAAMKLSDTCKLSFFI